MELSILIPSRQEPFLEKTLDDLHEKIAADTEVLWMEDDGRGQRRCTTALAEWARGKYILKCDAHVSFGPAFDRILLGLIDDRTILAPIMLPLDTNWAINGKKQMKQYAFDTTMTMQHVPGEAGETMCLAGACFMTSKDNYFNWLLDDPDMPSWGGQTVELGIKAFLNGGRCFTTDATYFGHIFRHSSEEFPYERGENPGKLATEVLVRKYKNAALAPLIERFNFPCDWTVDNVKALDVV